MRKVIIGIHGLGNKPPKELLKTWWKRSIREGLKAIKHPHFLFKFELVYWAHFFHHELLDPGETNRRSPLFIEDPYAPAREFKKGEANPARQKLLDYIDKQLNKIFLNDDMSINYSAISDFIIHHLFSDLESYYSGTYLDANGQECPAKEIICEQLTSILKKYRKREILLIAHSMGSIIAYDVLTQSVPKIKINSLFTIGSPLGMPIVISKIIYEQRKVSEKKSVRVQTPENIRKRWYNFSDLRDKVAIYYRLSESYDKNSQQIGPADKIIYNNIEKNPHKSYGYLRAPEVSEAIHEFLIQKKSRLSLWIGKKFYKIVSKFYGIDYESQ